MTRICTKALFALLIAVALCACASTRYDRLVSHALHVCELQSSPDAGKGNGEAGFWYRSERADASRKLWNPGGREAIAARQATATTEGDRSCLAQLQHEADAGELLEE